MTKNPDRQVVGNLSADIRTAHALVLDSARKSGAVSRARADAFKNPGGNTTLPAGCGQLEAAYHAGQTAKGTRMTAEDIEPANKNISLWDRLGFRRKP